MTPERFECAIILIYYNLEEKHDITDLSSLFEMLEKKNQKYVLKREDKVNPYNIP